MSKLQINRETFIETGKNSYGSTLGTVEISFCGKTHVVPAVKPYDEKISVFGFVGRYATSSKAWAAHVTVDENNDIRVNFGRDDRSGRFNKRNAISFEPENFAKLTNEDYWKAAQ